MKELFEFFEKDLKSEDFSTREMIVYGIVAPMVLVAGCVIAEIIDKL